MNTVREISWPRILAEGAAIVVSILLAFWIEAWWDVRQDRQEEQVILTSILEEFRTKKQNVETSRTYNEWLLDAVKSLIAVGLGSDNSLSSDSVERLLSISMFNNEKGYWSAPALNSLISSGDVSRITNSNLRFDLGLWQQQFGRMDDYLARDVDFYHQQYIPYLVSNGHMPQLVNSLLDNPDINWAYGQKLPVLTAYDHSQMISERKFVNLLTARSILIVDIINEAYSNVDERLDLIILELEAELAK